MTKQKGLREASYKERIEIIAKAVRKVYGPEYLHRHSSFHSSTDTDTTISYIDPLSDEEEIFVKAERQEERDAIDKYLGKIK